MKYTCDVCKGEFESAWTDEEAMDEFRSKYPNYPFMDASVVCDECHKAMLNYTRSRSR